MNALISFLLLVVSIVVGWVGLIYGWGITPLNWWWIVGTTVVNTILLAAITAQRSS